MSADAPAEKEKSEIWESTVDLLSQSLSTLSPTSLVFLFDDICNFEDLFSQKL